MMIICKVCGKEFTSPICDAGEMAYRMNERLMLNYGLTFSQACKAVLKMMKLAPMCRDCDKIKLAEIVLLGGERIPIGTRPERGDE